MKIYVWKGNRCEIHEYGIRCIGLYWALTFIMQGYRVEFEKQENCEVAK